MIKKELAGIIICVLLVVTAVIPASGTIMVVKKPSYPKPSDVMFLANLSMSFGENIYNDRIEYVHKRYRPPGEYYVNVNISFRCPSNRKITVNYRVLAELVEPGPYQQEWITFCELEDSVTIINGSNPPDINRDYVRKVPKDTTWDLLLNIKATFKIYEYVHGYWIYIGEDSTDEWAGGIISFTRNRVSYSYSFLRFLEQFPILKILLLQR